MQRGNAAKRQPPVARTGGRAMMKTHRGNSRLFSSEPRNLCVMMMVVKMNMNGDDGEDER